MGTSSRREEEEEEEEEDGDYGEGDEDEDEDDDPYEALPFPLHAAINMGDMDALRRLLGKKTLMRSYYGEPGGEVRPEHDVDARDDDRLAPIHVAILGANGDAVRLLMEAGSNMLVRFVGSTPLHIAVSACAIKSKQAESLGVLKLILEHMGGAAGPGLEAACVADDYGRTVLHIAALFNLADATRVLLGALKGCRAAEEIEGSCEPNDAVALLDVQDAKLGETAAHVAARFQCASVLRQLIEAGCSTSLVDSRSRTLLHAGAGGGCVDCVEAILGAPQSREEASAACDERGEIPARFAERNGHGHLIPLLSDPPKVGSAEWREAAALARQGRAARGPTLLCYSPKCQTHRTHARGDDPQEVPPENMGRVDVLMGETEGILNSACFQEAPFTWRTDAERAAHADILRCHEWSYVHRVFRACALLEGDNEDIGNLDGDTAISARSALAAMHAAGCGIAAVDRIMAGEARNAFCPVRPPGHHAGPTGFVTNENDPQGSHGFCLLNNVAITASYALHVYRGRGIGKVAIIDFDVHHGNGTQKIVEGLVEGTAVDSFSSPYGEFTAKVPTFKPWLDDRDRERVFFASVHGYGRRSRHPQDPGWFYAGSGATSDVGFNSQPGPGSDEDPNGEFVHTGGEKPGGTGARIINVGIPGPGVKRNLWRRSWRDKVLPALRRFGPDMIVVSAGFDAHSKDLLNLGYVGLRDDDYDWITRELVKVSNACCGGRLVSILEGGYRIQGGEVSPFARSVAAHVRALGDPHGETWEFEDAEWERSREAERNQLRGLQRAAAAAGPSAARAASPAAAAAAAAADEGDTPGRKRRRQSKPVDYEELNAQLDKEKGLHQK